MEKEFVGNENKEFAILVCLIRDPLLLVTSNVGAGDFKNLHARQIYMIMDRIKNRAMENLDGSGIPDLSGTNLRATAEAFNIKYDPVVMSGVLGKIEDTVEIKSEFFDSYVRSVKNASVVDKVRNVAEAIKQQAESFNIEDDALKLLRDAENRILDIENTMASIGEPVPLFDPVVMRQEIEERKARRDKGDEPGYRTGFSSIDRRILGMVPKSLTVVGARAKTGKSAFALNVALNMAQEYGSTCPILYIDTEMSGEEQRTRALSILSGIDERKIRRHDLTTKEEGLYEKAVQELERIHKSFFHCYIPNFTAESIQAIARKYKNLHNVQFMIMDYIKLPDGADLKAAAEWQFLGYFTSMLKNKIAGTLNIPVLTFAQLNRSGVEQALAGEVDETSIGGSDRIVHYCTNYLCLRKASQEELNANKSATLKLHFVVTRNGGEHRQPVDISYTVDEGIPRMIETIKKVKDDGVKDEVAANKEAIASAQSQSKGHSNSAGGGKSK